MYIVSRKVICKHQLSGQIVIFHQPRFPWNKGISLTKTTFGVRSCEVAIIWPELYEGNLAANLGIKSRTWIKGGLPVLTSLWDEFTAMSPWFGSKYTKNRYTTNNHQLTEFNIEPSYVEFKIIQVLHAVLCAYEPNMLNSIAAVRFSMHPGMHPDPLQFHRCCSRDEANPWWHKGMQHSFWKSGETNDTIWYEMKKERKGKEMKWKETTETKWNDMKWNDMKWTKIIWNGMKCNEMKWNDIKWNDVKWNEHIF